MERSSRSVALPPLSGARVALQGWLSLLNRLWMFLGSHRYFFSTLPRTKPIEIDSRVPILSPRVTSRRRIVTPPLGSLTIRYHQRRATQSHSNRAVQRSLFGPLVVLSTAGVHQIFDSLLARKGRSTEQRSSTHQWRERTTLGHNPTYTRKTKTSWLPHPTTVDQRPYTILLARSTF